MSFMFGREETRKSVKSLWFWSGRNNGNGSVIIILNKPKSPSSECENIERTSAPDPFSNRLQSTMGVIVLLFFVVIPSG
jgi:hypothetical protein